MTTDDTDGSTAMAHRETIEFAYEIQGARSDEPAHTEIVEIGYEIEGAQAAGITVTDEMRARAERLAQESHDAADGPTSRAS